jgi:hypothetical protein
LGEFRAHHGPLMGPPSEQIAKIIDADSGQKWKVLDIAAGHGLFVIALAKHNPNPEIVALDWAAVLEVAQENAQKAGVVPTNETLLRKVHAALAPGGRGNAGIRPQRRSRDSSHRSVVQHDDAGHHRARRRLYVR